MNGMICNYNILGVATQNGYFAPARFAEYTTNGTYSWGPSPIKSVSDVTFLTDCRVWNWGWQIPYYEWNIDSQYGLDSTMQYGYAFRHPGERANMLYYDGHLAPVRHYLKTGVALFNWKFP
jgi:prepilin-type processing-associated H-X9-DG protein